MGVGTRVLTDWRPVDQGTVLRAWAIAEATSTKTPLGKAVAEGRCPPALRDKLLRRAPETLTEAEWQALERAIVDSREPLLRGLLVLRPEWYEGAVPVDALGEMRCFNMAEWLGKAPSRRLADLWGARQMAGPEPEFTGFATSVERPIAVGPVLDGPLCLLEGYTRCGALFRDMGAGLATLETVPLIVGVTPRIAEWTDGKGHRWW